MLTNRPDVIFSASLRGMTSDAGKRMRPLDGVDAIGSAGEIDGVSVRPAGCPATGYHGE